MNVLVSVLFATFGPLPLFAPPCSSFTAQDPAPTTSGKIQATVQRGQTWLLDRQLLDGSWEGWGSKYAGGITALTTYTLLKTGIPPEHPSVRRAFAYLETQTPQHTYSAGSLLLALSMVDDPKLLARMQETVHLLEDWLHPSGLFAYPHGNVDLSNTLFACLGMHAAAARGIKINPKTWLKILKGTLKCQGPEVRVPSPDGGYQIETGFSYGMRGSASGSMTSAGITVLKIIQEHAGKKIPPRDRKAVDLALERSVFWLGNHWELSKNPPDRLWRFYHLFGLERVGSLLKIETIGPHNWYALGADYLLRNQTPEGTWHEGYFAGTGAKVRAEYEELNTCMGLLFLLRATAKAFTGNSPQPVKNFYETQDADADVILRASGDTPLAIWIGKSEKELAQVRYVAWHDADPAKKAQTLGEPQAGDGRFAIQHPFEQCGPWWIQAQLESKDGSSFVSAPLKVQVEMVLEDKFIRYASDQKHNQIRLEQVNVSRSTQRNDNSAAKNAIDGLQGTAWVYDAKDDRPWIELQFQKPIRASRLLLSHAFNRRIHTVGPKIRNVEITLNKGKVYTLELPADPRTKGELDLGRKTKIGALRIQISDLWDHQLGQAAAGFSEIQLLP